MSKRQKQVKETMDAVTALNHLRQDIREMPWENLASDERTILVAKCDVLELVQDWIEYCLNPEQTTLAKVE